MPENNNNPDRSSLGEGGCPTCNDQATGEPLANYPNELVQPYTPATPEELEFTRNFYAAMKARSEHGLREGVAVQTQETSPGLGGSALHDGMKIPDISGLSAANEGPAEKSGRAVTPSMDFPAPSISERGLVAGFSDTDVLMGSQLSAPWVEPDPAQFLLQDDRFVKPEEPFSEIFYTDKSRGYQFPVPPRMIPQPDGTWLFLPCCRVLTGPRFTTVGQSAGIRHIEGRQLPDGSRAQGRIEVRPTELRDGRFGVQFSFAATFLDQLPEYKAACCEIRLLFTVLNAHTDAVPYPHSGFSRREDPRKAWVEDRRQDGRKYGHRSDSNASSDWYDPERKTGDSYSGNDTPGFSRKDATAAAGSGEIWRYMVVVIDTCCGGIRGMSDVLDVVWARTKFR